MFHFSIFTRILPKKTPPFPFMGLDKYHHPISTITPSLQLGLENKKASFLSVTGTFDKRKENLYITLAQF